MNKQSGNKTMINGTIYQINGGKTLVNGTIYTITNGKTIVGGTIRTLNTSVVNTQEGEEETSQGE